jgi:uncharacterized integral membrane protein
MTRGAPMRWFCLAVVTLFAVLILVFIFQNSQSVEVFFLRSNFNMRLAFLIAAAYVLGAATGGGLLALLRWSYKGAGLQPTAAR